MSIEFFFRIVGMIFFAILGAVWGKGWGESLGRPPEFFSLIFALLGALTGLILTPYLTTRPVRKIRNSLSRISAQTLAAGLVGLVAGLLIAALLSFPLSLLPSPMGDVLPFVGVVLFGYLGVVVFAMRKGDIFTVLKSGLSGRIGVGNSGEPVPQESSGARSILLDTSVIVDGRIADIARTGFISGTMIIPRFVLNELQYIADSADGLKRQRGRRGMEVLSQLQKDSATPVQISDLDVEGIREVDDKLVVLARQLRSPILTNDYNLNRIADLQGVTVLNINELANSVKAVVLPGETLQVEIIQEGRESDQGVAYLEDGTMVVVEDGHSHIGKQRDVSVTKVLQTAAGRMVFSRIKDNNNFKSRSKKR